MIEHYLGADAFRDGVRRYMERHREGNAVAADLWRALGEASGSDVARVAQAWIAQPGFPLVTLTRDGGARCASGRSASSPIRGVAAAKRRQRWPVPLVVAARRTRRRPTARALVDKASQTVPLPARAPAVVLRQRRRRRLLPRAARRGDAAPRCSRRLDALGAVERLALVGDQWALVRADRAPIESFLDLADALGDEPDHDVARRRRGRARPSLDEQVRGAGSAAQAALRAWIARRFGPALARARLDGRARTRPTRCGSGARRCCASSGGVAEAPDVLAEARRRLDALSRRPRRARAEPRRRRWRALAARVGDAALYERYRDVAAAARTPQERRRFLLNLASFRTPRRRSQRTLDALLSAEIPTQDVAFLLMRLFGNPAGRDDAWRFLTPTVDARCASASRRSCWRASSRPRRRCATPRHAREVREFFRAHPLPEAARALRQALERFRLNAELRRRTGAGRGALAGAPRAA